MVYTIHKAFELIGQRILIIDSVDRNKKGIFQESKEYQTNAEGGLRPALDFIEPIYSPNKKVEFYAKSKIPKERINSRNPVLSLHLGLDHLKLNYKWQKNRCHVFEGELNYICGVFFNDGNSEVFNSYVKQLNKAGFEVYEV